MKKNTEIKAGSLSWRLFNSLLPTGTLRACDSKASLLAGHFDLALHTDQRGWTWLKSNKQEINGLLYLTPMRPLLPAHLVPKAHSLTTRTENGRLYSDMIEGKR